MTECGPDRNLCHSLKGGGFGDYQGSWERGVVWSNQKVRVPRRECRARHRETYARPFTCCDVGQLLVKSAVRRTAPVSRYEEM